MNSIITRRSGVAASRTHVSNHIARTATRTYAETPLPKQKSAFMPTPGLIGAVAFLTLVPSYYIMNSSKKAGSGQAEIKERRRENGGTHNEYRDPRDSPIKTIGQKKEKEQREAKEAAQ